MGDIDILATASRPEEIIAAFVRMPMVEEVLGKGPTKASIIVQRDDSGGPEDRGAQILWNGPPVFHRFKGA